MPSVNISKFRSELFSMTDRALGGERILITSKNGNTVLVSEDDWNSIMETVYLLSDPETLPAVKEARETPTSELEVWDCHTK
jgi:prevent-host-death family protein